MAREITIRRSKRGDEGVLATLAALDGRPEPRGAALLAFVDGEAWAAVPVAGGPAIADPFRPAGELVELLNARLAQLREPTGGDEQAGRLRRLHGAVARVASLAAAR